MKLVPVMFWILALVHMTPAIVAVSPNQIASLYGIAPDNKTLIALLQHRGVLLGLIGVAFAYAAHKSLFRWPVLILGSLSMILFILIATLQGQLSGDLMQIVVIDTVSLVLAALAAILMLRSATTQKIE